MDCSEPPDHLIFLVVFIEIGGCKCFHKVK